MQYVDSLSMYGTVEVLDYDYNNSMFTIIKSYEYDITFKVVT